MGDRELVVTEGDCDDVADCSVEYHESTGTYRTEFDYRTRQATEAVILGVADVTDRDPLSLPPIYEAIDPDSLNHLFCKPDRDPTPAGLSVTFQYADQTVTAHDHGTVEILPPH